MKSTDCYLLHKLTPNQIRGQMEMSQLAVYVGNMEKIQKKVT
jgi:hypothetical protein